MGLLMMFWTGHDPTGWGWVAMTVGMAVLWGLLITLAVVLVRGLNRPAGPADGPRSSPERLLAERFARGEIDEDEYRRRLATLTGADRTTPMP
jgi:putative membrane protein